MKVEPVTNEIIEKNIGVNITTFGRKLTLFSAIPFFRFSLKMSRFFVYFRDWKNALYHMRSAERQVEVRQLGNQLPVLGKANSLCAVGNIIVTTRDINDSENVSFVGLIGLQSSPYLIVVCLLL